MLRIIAILQEKIEEQKMKNKVSRVKNSIQSCRLNLETDMMELEDKQIKTVESLKDKSTDEVLTALVDIRRKMSALKETSEKLDEVENYLFTELQKK